jgi:hypothetical protein
MSTIKSSSEHLVLNADGVGKDISLQANGSTKVTVKSDGNVGIGSSETTMFNAVGGVTRLSVTGSSSSTNIAGNTSASIAIVNTDQTQNNTAGLHFARADTDDTPNYAGSSVVAQFEDTQATGQYPKASLIFLTSTAANTAPSEKLRIQSGGGISFNGDTAAANALDDYEEGNWTPIWNPTGGSWSGTGVGKYTKVGRQVTASLRWTASSQATGSKFNGVWGLPFTSLDETTTYPAIVHMNGGGASGNSLTAVLMPNNTAVYLQMQPDNTGTHGEFTPAQTRANCEFHLTVTYMTP